MAAVVDGDGFTADVEVLAVARGDQQVEGGCGAGTDQPGERRDAVEVGHQCQHDGQQGCRQEGRDGAQVDAPRVEVGPAGFSL